MVCRYLYREAMKGILPEMIRVRPDKHEAFLANLNMTRRKTDSKMIQTNNGMPLVIGL